MTRSGIVVGSADPEGARKGIVVVGSANPEGARKGIVVVGSANLDLVAEVPSIPGPGETVLGTGLAVHEGGKGANQAVAAARAGGEVTLVCSLGRDAHGERLLDSLRRAGVSTARVHRCDAPTGTALICVDAAGQNSIAVVPGANAELTPERVGEAAGEIARAAVLLLQLEVPIETVAEAARAAAEAGVRVVLDPAPARPLDPALLACVEVLTPNESEAARLTGEPVAGVEGAAAAADRLLRAGPAAVVVTLGADGALLATREGAHEHLPAFPATAVDTTAAGDVFSGALAVALSEGRALREAVRFAAAAAAISVSRPGAQRSAPRRAEIEAVLAGTPVDRLST